MIKEQYIGLSTIARKEVSRIFRIWIQTLLPSAITMTLYFVIFGSFLGSRIGQIQDISYLDFIAPGLIIMSVLNNSYYNVVSSFFSAKFSKSVEELLISPLSPSMIILGYVMGGMARGLLTGLIVTIISMWFTTLSIYSLWVVISTIFLTSLLFSIAGFINALFSKKFDDVSIVPTFILTPLIYLGGIFYSIESLSPFWQTLSKFNPILYIINTFRYGFFGISDIPVFESLISIVIAIFILWSTAHYLLRKGFGTNL